MASTIQLKRSSVAGLAPEAGNILVGEPVVNLTDKVIYTKNGSGSVIIIGAGTTSNVSEGSNLYFSNVRAIDAVELATTKLDVTAPGFFYSIDQYSGNNPEIFVTAGETIAFSLNVSGHPFLIRESSGGTNYNNGLIHVATDGTISTGSSAQAKQSGTLYWKVPYVLKGNVFVYQCQVHGSMVANINILDPNKAALLTTSNVAEGSNLYFTDTRVFANLLNATTSSLTEGSNLYFTNTRSISAFTAGQNISIASNGRITATVSSGGGGGNVTSVNGLVGDVVLTTTEITEGANLYFTNARVVSAITGGDNVFIAANGLITITGGGGGGSGNVDSVNGQTGVVVLTTANVAESGNLYFTNTRVVSALTSGENITIASNGRITASAIGGGSTVYSNVILGEVQNKEFTANGNVSSFDLDFNAGNASSLFVFVDGVIQAPATNYSVNADIITFVSPPADNAIVTVRYFDSSNIFQTKYFLGFSTNESFIASGANATFGLNTTPNTASDLFVFVNGAIQEPTTNYTVSGSDLVFTSNPDANASVIVKYFSPHLAEISTANIAEGGSNLYFTTARVDSRIALANVGNLNDVSSNTPSAGQALVWDANINSWAPGNVVSSATTLALYTRFEFTTSNNQTVFTGGDDNGSLLSVNSDYAEVFFNGIRLIPAVDYTANSTHVILVEPAGINDVLSVINFVDSAPDFIADQFTGDGSNTIFALSRTPSNEASILITFDGVRQHTSEYTLNGANLTFTTPPDPATNIEIVHLGTAQASSSASTETWLEVSSNVSVSVDNKYLVNTAANPITLTLPSTPDLGDTIYFLDATNSFASNHLTINRNGNKIMSAEDNLLGDTNGAYFGLVYFNVTYGWRILQ